MKNNDKVINEQLLEFSAFDKFYPFSEFGVVLFELEFLCGVELVFHRKVAISALTSELDDDSIAFFSHGHSEQK